MDVSTALSVLIYAVAAVILLPFALLFITGVVFLSESKPKPKQGTRPPEPRR